MIYHAKGRGATGHRTHSAIRVYLEEKPTEVFFRELLEGKVPQHISQGLKQQFLETDAPLEEIKSVQYLLTAKGRQQNRLMMKRRV